MDFYNKFIERRKDYFDIVAYLLSLYKIRLYKKCTNINELIDVTKTYVGYGHYRSSFVLLIFDGGKSARPTATPLLSQPVIELHLRVEFKFLKKREIKEMWIKLFEKRIWYRIYLERLGEPMIHNLVALFILLFGNIV
ncbi:uncharacterized protein METZ01_LOCUS320585, partial [marine metagenome]